MLKAKTPAARGTSRGSLAWWLPQAGGAIHDLPDWFAHFDAALSGYRPPAHPVEIGTVATVGQGVARVRGLPGVAAMERVRFADDSTGIAFDLDVTETGIVLLRDQGGLRAGATVERTGQVVDTPVGMELLGRVVNALGESLDGAIRSRPANAGRWNDPRRRSGRAPVSVPLAARDQGGGCRHPIGRGQRGLILGDRQTGKTALAVDAILNQADQNVICVYCAIGRRGAAVAQVIAALRRRGRWPTAWSWSPPARSTGFAGVHACAATSIAEWFMTKGATC
ncbi:MAG: hypothetical protein U1F70_11875 [Candidatus Competibacteraceae bacterium]